MNIKMLKGYIMYCKTMGVKPTWKGLQALNRQRRNIINGRYNLIENLNK